MAGAGDSIIDHAAYRAALMEWRDAAMLSAMALVHQAAAEAMAALEARIETIAIVDAALSPESAVRGVLRPLMRDRLRGPADRWFDAQARALRRIDPRLERRALDFGALHDRPTLPREEPSASSRGNMPAWLRTSADRIGTAAAAVTSRALPGGVRDGAAQAAARVGREIGERSGTHARLRAAAQAELAATWTGSAAKPGAPPAFLAQLFDRIDRTADDALAILG